MLKNACDCGVLGNNIHVGLNLNLIKSLNHFWKSDLYETSFFIYEKLLI